MNIGLVLGDVILGSILLIAVVYDQREQRIPNYLILIGLICGISWNVYATGLEGLLFSLKGFLVGLALLFIPFVMGGMGAGDVKLLGVVGIFKGYLFAFHTFVYMALWGGLIAVVLLIVKGKLFDTLHRLLKGLVLSFLKIIKLKDSIEKNNSEIYFPYALAIALGAVSAYFISWW